MENITIKATDDFELKCLYSKVDNPKAIIQIIHGMVEHKERYKYLIENLNQNGYSVIISDLRGHGESINDEYSFGRIGSIDLMVSDQYEVTKFIKNDNPDKDLYIFAHSMGTLIARCYIKSHDQEIKKLILSGTVAYKPFCGLAVSAAKKRSKGEKKNNYSKLLYAMSNNFSSKDDISWISYSEENIKNYSDDPLCGFKFTNFSNYVLFSMTKDLHNKKNKCNNPDLVILSISGIDDRTTSYTKGVKDSVKWLNKRGYKNVSYIEYPNMKHEILNEDGKEKVVEDIISFYNK